MTKENQMPNSDTHPLARIGRSALGPKFFRHYGLGISHSRQAGFTLLELLIAISIFAMVLTAINGVFYAAMRLQSKTSRSVEEGVPLQQAVGVLKRDLQGIVLPGGVLGGSLQSGTTTTPS